MKSLIFAALLVGFASCASVFDVRSLEDFQKSFKRKSLVDSLKNQLQNHPIKRLVEEQLKQQKLARETANSIRRDAVEVEIEPQQPRRDPCEELIECPETDGNAMLPIPSPNGTYTFTAKHVEIFCNFSAEIQTCYDTGRYSQCTDMDDISDDLRAVRSYVCHEGKLPTVDLLNCVHTKEVEDSFEKIVEAFGTLRENGIAMQTLPRPDNICCLKDMAKSLFNSFILHHCGIQASMAAFNLSDQIINMEFNVPVMEC